MFESFPYEPVLAWVAFAVVLLFTLPFAGTRKLLLEVCALAVRLTILALLAGGALLWFRPDLLPAEVVSYLDAIPGAWDILPPPASQVFGLVVGCTLAAALLPLLAILDVTRKLAGYRLRRLRQFADGRAPAPAPSAAEQPAPLPRRADRRAAADTLAEAGSRKPFRVSDRLS
ncbi:MAG: hypothetical protein L0Z62_35950 [Gemmataceae bacterium]|nr:hypothetical protein [Gemmataceae bacterium]